MPVLLAAGLFPAAVHAAPFSAFSATASSEFPGGYGAGNTIDGSGLSSNTAVGEEHAVYRPGNHWTTASGTNPLNASIEWEFAAPVTLAGIYIWNHGSQTRANGGVAANEGYEPTLFDLTIKGLGGSVLNTFSNVALAPNTRTAQAFTFPEFSGVTKVLFAVRQTEFSTSFTGLAEVAFDDERIAGATVLGTTTPVPLPAGLPLMASVLGIVAALRLRKRANHA